MVIPYAKMKEASAIEAVAVEGTSTRTCKEPAFAKPVREPFILCKVTSVCSYGDVFLNFKYSKLSMVD